MSEFHQICQSLLLLSRNFQLTVVTYQQNLTLYYSDQLFFTEKHFIMKKKMKLDSLKVKSFVTKVDESKEETVKGGRPVPIQPIDFSLLVKTCTWYSELNTACTCPESEIPLCIPGPIEEV